MCGEREDDDLHEQCNYHFTKENRFKEVFKDGKVS